MVVNNQGFVRGLRDGFIIGLFGAIVGGIGVAAGWIPAPLTAAMIGGVGFAAGLAENLSS